MNRIKVGTAIPHNSSYKYTLYAVFDEKGHFLHFMYGKMLTCFVDDLIDLKVGLVNCDIKQLYKIEKL